MPRPTNLKSLLGRKPARRHATDHLRRCVLSYWRKSHLKANAILARLIWRGYVWLLPLALIVSRIYCASSVNLGLGLALLGFGVVTAVSFGDLFGNPEWFDTLPSTFGNELNQMEYPMVIGIQEALRLRKATKGVDKGLSMHRILGAVGVPCSDLDYRKPAAQVYREMFGDLLR
jgi:hypothetical protein